MSRGIDSPPLPPGNFVSEAGGVAVMGPAQGGRELIAHLESHRTRLGEPQMVGIKRTSPAGQTWAAMPRI